MPIVLRPHSLVFLIVHCAREFFPLWKSANIIPLPKTKPLMSVKTDIRPISITPIAAKVFESIIMKYVDDIVCDAMDILSNLGV